ncbi:MAG: YXWGXW repeat-containing protein, partial [Mucilaginibacter sp.]
MKKFVKVFVIVCAVCFAASNLYAQVSISLTVRTAPPALPVYEQPECPSDGYIWQPGYWAYDDADGYYWVPGAWIAPPNPGLYWTPAYWGYAGSAYGFHAGYWGPHVGFYGGINYGYGYGGYGYGGGRWQGNRFEYNTAVVNVNRTIIHNTYIDRTVVNTTVNRSSYNGPGGVNARPRPQEQAAMRERHVQPTPDQVSHQQAAHSDRASFANVNHGRPAVAAVSRPGADRKDARPAVNRPSSRTQVAGPGATRPEQKERPEQKQRAERPEQK